MGRVEGKVALVTGGAMGMGKTHAELLAREGAEVWVCDREAGQGAAVAEAIVAAGGKARFLSLDVTREEDWAQAVAEVGRVSGRLDILVNNAGIVHFAALHETAPADFDRVFAVNVRGTYLGIRAAVPLMKAGGGGAIVNISSIYGLVGARNAGAYIATKGAVRLMTHDLLHGDPAAATAILGPTLIRRPSAPEEVSWAVLYLASDEASYVTGAELAVDGGYTAN